jgi:hypothetical protein
MIPQPQRGKFLGPDSTICAPCTDFRIPASHNVPCMHAACTASHPAPLGTPNHFPLNFRAGVSRYSTTTDLQTIPPQPMQVPCILNLAEVSHSAELRRNPSSHRTQTIQAANARACPKGNAITAHAFEPNYCNPTFCSCSPKLTHHDRRDKKLTH